MKEDENCACSSPKEAEQMKPEGETALAHREKEV